MESLNPKVKDAVRSGLMRAIPEISVITVGDVTLLCQGWESEIHVLDVAYTRDGVEEKRAIVLRVYQGADAAAKAEREFRGMHKLWEMGYPVPEVLFVETSLDVIGRVFMAMERVDGRPLSHIFDEADDAGKGAIVQLYLQTFVRLHTMDWAEFDPTAGGMDPSDPYACIDRTLKQIDDFLGWMNIQELKPIFDWFRSRRDSVPSRRISIVHGDYHGMNILMEPSGAVKVLDWSQLRVGDLRSDLGWTLLLSGAEGNPQRRNEIVAAYEAILGEELEQMPYFEGLAAAFRLAVAWASVKNGTQALGMHEDAMNGMRQAINHYRGVYGTFVTNTQLDCPEFRSLLEQLAS